MKEFKTLVDVLHIPKGTKVSFDEGKDTIGKTGKLLCTIPTGGALFYAHTDLEPVEKSLGA